MMMQMLEAGGVPVLTDGIRTADADNPKGYYEFERVKQIKNDSSWLDDARGKAVKMIHLLLTDLPLDRPYHVIFMKRHLDEVLVSQTAMLERHGKKGAALTADRLAKVYRQQLEKVTNWLTANDQRLAVLNVDHHGVLRDPISQATRIGDFLGGSLDTAAMAAIVDPRLHRQRADDDRR